jgi:septum formation protein
VTVQFHKAQQVLLLASASPRRRELLEKLGLVLEVVPADVDESVVAGEAPDAYVKRIARAKATAVARSDRWVLAADTTVTIDGAILAKAESDDEAAAMLRQLSGRTHLVLTAFVLAKGDRIHEAIVSTDVVMIDLDEAVIADYVACREWVGKAGAYALQGIAGSLVRSISGSVTNVIGLPVAEVIAALREVGGPLPRFVAGKPS